MQFIGVNKSQFRLDLYPKFLPFLLWPADPCPFCLCGHLLLVCLCILLHVVQDDVLSTEGELEVEVHGADSKGGAVAAPYLDTVATRKLQKFVECFKTKECTQG